ncbi:MAG TPA: glycosyltransferase family protein [Bryobacteraceae bacterium]
MTGAIVQARMGSSRLPGKVMLPGAGKPLLGHLLDRLQACRQLDVVIVATSINQRDDVIADYCHSDGIPAFRGSEQDVLDRYYRAAKRFNLSTIVRVTSDCPLIDPVLIDEQLRLFRPQFQNIDLVTNRHPLTFADGLDFDIMPIASLERVWRTATEAHQREHVVPYFWESGMRVNNFEDPQKHFLQHRWTLDYPEDYELIASVLKGLSHKRPLFTTQDILDYVTLHPSLPLLNARFIER